MLDSYAGEGLNRVQILVVFFGGGKGGLFKSLGKIPPKKVNVVILSYTPVPRYSVVLVTFI